MKIALQTVGVLALVLWTAFGAFAWSKVSDRLEVTIQEAGDAGDDPLVLLEDRVATLSQDLDALVDSLGTNFQLVATAIQDEGALAEGERARIDERLRALEAALPAALQARETAGALAAVLDRLERLEPAPGAPLARRADASEEAGAPEPDEVAAVAPDAPDETVAAAAEPSAPARSEPAPRRSFLAFQLPDRDFRFEGTQTFELLGDLSRVGFDAKSTLHDFTGVSNRVQGELELDLARPEQGVHGLVEIRSSSLVTGLEGRDEAMLEHLAAEEHERILFEPVAFETGAVDAEARTVNGTVLGRMTIRGQTRDLRMPVRAHVDESRRLVLEGEVPI